MVGGAEPENEGRKVTEGVGIDTPSEHDPVRGETAIEHIVNGGGRPRVGNEMTVPHRPVIRSRRRLDFAEPDPPPSGASGSVRCGGAKRNFVPKTHVCAMRHMSRVAPGDFDHWPNGGGRKFRQVESAEEASVPYE